MVSSSYVLTSSSIEYYEKIINDIIKSSLGNDVKMNLLKSIKFELDLINCNGKDIKCIYGNKILNVTHGVNAVKVVCGSTNEVLTGYRYNKKSRDDFNKCPYKEMSNRCLSLINSL